MAAGDHIEMNTALLVVRFRLEPDVKSATASSFTTCLSLNYTPTSSTAFYYHLPANINGPEPGYIKT